MSNLREGVWLGPELITPAPKIIAPRSKEHVLIDMRHARRQLPTDLDFTSGTTIFSTRSRIAQLGAELPRDVNEILPQHLKGDKRKINLPVVNHAAAPVALDEGPVGRLMHRTGPPVEGDLLENLIATGFIQPGGEEGPDWWLARNYHGKPVGVGLNIVTPELWIPPRDEPIGPTGPTTHSFRTDMNVHFVPIEPGDAPTIRISQTRQPLFTQPNYMAFLDPHGMEHVVMPAGIHNATTRQTNAPGLYASYPATPWPIRTELLSTPEEMDGKTPRGKAVIATFYPVVNPITA